MNTQHEENSKRSIQAKENQMNNTWSADYPTEKGWYWCKCDVYEPWIVAYDPEMIRPGRELEGKFAGPQLYWSGPIFPPEEKAHA